MTPEEYIKAELDAFIKTGKAKVEVNSGNFVTTHIDPLKVAKHFAEWQREQMMKDAIDAVVAEGSPMPFQESIPVLTNTDMILLPKDKFSIGDKVKVIIIKE